MCNICFMIVETEKTSPIEQLRRSLPDLPERLQEAGRFIADHEFDATTRSMRDLAASARLQPATFTRLAQAIGHTGWDEFRKQLIEARRPDPPGPFSDRVSRRGLHGQTANGRERLVAGTLAADTTALARIDVQQVVRVAAALQRASRIWVVGYRSCRSVASLLHYQLSLFRPDVRLVGAVGPEDIDFGSFRKGDAVVVIGFAPYSRASVVTAGEARKAGCILIAIADRPGAPIAEGTDLFLRFEAGLTPAFFHSLTGAIAIVQTLAAVVFELDGAAGAARLRRTEARLADFAQYMADEAPT
jgi:DNA-binding MurR/RpiR family transcriptional regulator